MQLVQHKEDGKKKLKSSKAAWIQADWVTEKTKEREMKLASDKAG